MPGLKCVKHIYLDKPPVLTDLFGFYQCEIDAPLDSYLGLLPFRDKSGICFPVGKWTGWYFSEELKFAQQNGYKIKVLTGYTFNRKKDVFKDYINFVYDRKSNPINSTQKSMAKSLLNNLLGRFGIGLDKPVTEIVNHDDFERISTTKKIVSYTKLEDNKYIITFLNKLDQDIMRSHGMDMIKVIEHHPDKEIDKFIASSVVISAAVTAYARIHMCKTKLGILSNGGKIWGKFVPCFYS